MTNHEQIYALFVEANPYPDVESLPESLEADRVPLHVAGSFDTSEQGHSDTARDSIAGVGTRLRRPGRIAVVAAALVIVAATAALVARNLESSGLSAGSETHINLTYTERAVEFISLLTAGDLDEAESLLAEPIGTIWFPLIGQVSDIQQVRNYLEFYVAIDVATEISECVEQTVGPLTEVTCSATQTAGHLSRLGLKLPRFDMSFSVWDSGIQEIRWELNNPREFDVAFTQSRFYVFRDQVLRPLGLVQSNGDPVWSKENGEHMSDLIDDFLAENP